VATVDNEGTAGHEAASVGQAEENSAAEFLGPGQAAKHVLGFPYGASGGVVLEDLVDHRGDDVTGQRELTRMPWRPHSMARERLSWMTAALELL